MGLKSRHTKFDVFTQTVRDVAFNKEVDERAWFEVYPNTKDYAVLDDVRKQIASYAKGNLIGKDGTIMDVFKNNARMVEERMPFLRWKLYTQEGDLRSSIIKNYEINNPTPGLGESTFEIGLDSDLYGPNDIIIFEGLREIPLLVRSHGFPDGMSTKYEVAMFSEEDFGAYFPSEYITVGTRIIQIGSLIGERTTERGNISFRDGEAYIEFEVPQTRMGWEMKITDKAHLASKNYVIVPTDKDLRKSLGTSPIAYNELDAKFIRETNFQKDMWLTYGRSAGRFASKFLDGITQKSLDAGPGWFEYMESSYVIDYTPSSFSLDIFKTLLPTLWNDKVDPENQVVDIYTGRGGLIQWQKACEAADVYGTLQTPEVSYSTEEALYRGRNGVALGAKQYRAVYIEPFGLIRVHHLAFLDSELVDSRKYNGLPLPSYEYIVFNYGYGDGRDSNVYITTNPDVEQYGYSIGTWSPLGPVLGKQNLHNRFHNGLGTENAFKYIHECQFGLVVKDPSSMIWFRPAVKI